MNRPRRWDIEATGIGDDVDMVVRPKGNYVLMEDYVELERRHQTIMDAIEKTGSLENIRRVEVSQPIVIDMARENAWMKGTINRLIEAGDAMMETYFNDVEWTYSNREKFNNMPEVQAWNEAKRTNPNPSQPNA